MSNKRRYTKRTYPDLSFSHMNGVIGTISELRVACDLFLRGYYAFRAMSPHCPCDLIGLRKGELTTFEVRTANVTGTGKISCDKSKHADVLAIVLADKIIYEPPIFKFDS